MMRSLNKILKMLQKRLSLENWDITINIVSPEEIQQMVPDEPSMVFSTVWYDGRRAVIYLRDGLAPREIIASLYHELIHLLFWDIIVYVNTVVSLTVSKDQKGFVEQVDAYLNNYIERIVISLEKAFMLEGDFK